MLLGGDDFRRAVTIAASAGYDTDCNAGSVGCLNGVRLGLAAIPAELREPVADRLLVVTAEGGRCVSDAVHETRRILHAGAAFRSVPGSRDVAGFAPARWPRFGFELPGARQGFAPCPHAPAGAAPVRVAGSDDPGVVLHYRDVTAVAPARVSTPVFLDFDEVADNFSTHASPTLYATQEVTVRVEAPPPATAAGTAPAVAIYALYYDAADRVQELRSSAQTLRPGANTLRWQVPPNGGMPLFRIGLELAAPPGGPSRLAGSLRLLSEVDGAPRDFRQRGLTVVLEPAPALAARLGARSSRPTSTLLHLAQRRQCNPRHPRLARLRGGTRLRQPAPPRRPGAARHAACGATTPLGGATVAIVARHNDACTPSRRPPSPTSADALYFAAAGNSPSTASPCLRPGTPLPERRRRLRHRRHHARRRLPCAESAERTAKRRERCSAFVSNPRPAYGGACSPAHSATAAPQLSFAAPCGQSDRLLAGFPPSVAAGD